MSEDAVEYNGQHKIGEAIAKRVGNKIFVSMDLVFTVKDCNLVDGAEYRYTIPSWSKSVGDTLGLIASTLSRTMGEAC